VDIDRAGVARDRALVLVFREARGHGEVETTIAVEVAQRDRPSELVTGRLPDEGLARCLLDELVGVTAIDPDNAPVHAALVGERNPDDEVHEPIVIDVAERNRRPELVEAPIGRERQRGLDLEAALDAPMDKDRATVIGFDVGLGDTKERLGQSVAIEVRHHELAGELRVARRIQREPRRLQHIDHRGDHLAGVEVFDPQRRPPRLKPRQDTVLERNDGGRGRRTIGKRGPTWDDAHIDPPAAPRDREAPALAVRQRELSGRHEQRRTGSHMDLRHTDPLGIEVADLDEQVLCNRAREEPATRGERRRR